MIGRLILALLLAVAAAVARAETVTVRSGDHPNFSRLVLTYPAGTEWALGRAGQSYGLRLGAGNFDFATEAVFTRISRARIADLAVDDAGNLLIKVDCTCYATAFLWQPGKLVVDVVEGPAPDDRFEATLEGSTGSATADRSSVPEATGFPVVFATPPLAGLPIPAEPEPQIAPTEMSALERGLVESVARAASQGLLEPAASSTPATVPTGPAATGQNHLPDAGSTDFAKPEPQAVTPLGDPAAPAGADRATALVSAINGLPGVTAQTSIDRDRPAAPTAAPGLTADGCMADAEVAVATWGDDRDFGSQIAARYAALTGEFDRIPAGAVEGLARSYIYFGFGREAHQALAVDGTRSQERNILTAMAALVDGETDPQHLFADQITCPTDAAFWALLDRGAETGMPAPDLRRIRRTYLALPPPLIGHLGNRLAAIFVALGDPEAAEMLLSAAAPGLTTSKTDSAETAADVAALRGDNGGAIDQLTALATDDARLTPVALLRLFALAAAAGKPVDDNLLELAAALQFENRANPVAADLAVARVNALVAAARFDAGRDLIGEIAPLLGPVQLTDLHRSFADGLTARASDIAFLRFALAGLPPDVGAEAENAAATRLLALGFPDRAAFLLLAPAQFAAAAERRYLRAEAAIGMAEPDAALAAISGMTDTRAARLRAAALAMQGDYGAALSSGLATGDPDNAEAEAWRAGAWARLSRSEDPLLQAAAGAMLTAPVATDLPPSLSAGQAALADAGATRAMIGDLMTRFAIDPAISGAPGL